MDAEEFVSEKEYLIKDVKIRNGVVINSYWVVAEYPFDHEYYKLDTAIPLDLAIRALDLQAENTAQAQEIERLRDALEVNKISQEEEDIVLLLDESIREYGDSEKQLLGWRQMAEIDGWTAERWTRAINRMSGAGCPIMKQSGVGTFVNRDNLLKWYRFFRFSPTPPTNPNN